MTRKKEKIIKRSISRKIDIKFSIKKNSESGGDESEHFNALNQSSQIALKLDYVYRAEHFLHTKVLVEFILWVRSQRQDSESTCNKKKSSI